jgi:hypothetical protein
VYRFSRCATNFICGRGGLGFCVFNRSHYLILCIFGCSLKIICCHKSLSEMFEAIRRRLSIYRTFTSEPLLDDHDFRSTDVVPAAATQKEAALRQNLKPTS